MSKRSYGPYSVILADPPWRFKNWSMKELAVRGEKWARRNGRSPYDVMDTAALCRIPVPELAARDCVLFLWTTFPKLFEAKDIIEAWGFTYKTAGFTWAKQNPSGKGWKFGLGFWTRGNAEVCLLATRGKPKRVSNRVAQLVVAPVGNHSAKPPAVRDGIVALMGDVPRIELFARDRASGWEALGSDLDGLDITESIRQHLAELEARRIDTAA